MGKIAVPGDFVKPPETAISEARERDYQRMIAQTRKLIQSSTPDGATVTVISRGDDNLVKLEGRHGWHFPRQEDGKYAGYHPSDSAAAIGHLEVLRARGAEFLLIPRTALWWLEFYADFRRHLEACYRKIRSDKNGLLYELARPGAGAGARVTPVPERVKRKMN